MSNNAFNRALALESIPEALRYVDHELLVTYARTVAYKVAKNLDNGLQMNEAENPLQYHSEASKDVH